MSYELLEEDYFDWLCSKVEDPRSRRHTKLLKALHRTEFVWLVQGDDNREADGKALRREFIVEKHIRRAGTWRTLEECSMLEMLVAFARRAEWMTSIRYDEWFWRFMENLKLTGNSHSLTYREIESTLERVIWRQYDESGEGGLFPMQRPRANQREVELWYQLSEYLLDRAIGA